MRPVNFRFHKINPFNDQPINLQAFVYTINDTSYTKTHHDENSLRDHQAYKTIDPNSKILIILGDEG